MSHTSPHLRLLAVAAAAALTLAACGSEEDDSTGGGGDDASADLSLISDGTLTVCSDIPYAPFEFEDPDAESG